MDYLTIIFTIILIILTIVLTVVGIQLIFTLIEFKKTLKKINSFTDNVEMRIEQVTAPLAQLTGATAGLQTGMKMFELFIGWLQRDKNEKKLGKGK